ncbi:MAG: hypothetical protein ABIO43_07385 [Sphingomicrobium sp.]
MATRPMAEWPPRSIVVAAPARAVSTGSAATLSDLEWSIVAMAERDSLASLRTPNRFWRLLGELFGVKPANRLANDRLEALRRIAVLAWRHRWNVPESEVQSFVAAGFTHSHHELLQNRIARARADQHRRNSQ